MKVSRLVL